MTLGEQARRRALRYSSGGTIAATLAVYERLMSRADYGSQDLTAGVRKTY
jgi:hypothetical protein